MKCDLRSNYGVLGGRKIGGYTLLELLIVVAIVGLIAISGLMTVLGRMKKVNDATTSRMAALQSARHALDSVAGAFKQCWYRDDGGTDPFFFGENDPNYKPYGNRKDDDDDAPLIDEELYNGKADVAQPWVPAFDMHARLGPTSPWYERRYFRNEADPGDLHLDCDTKFASATLSFRAEPKPDDPYEVGRRVETYGIGTHNGKNHVLLQKVERYGLLGEHIDTVVSPLSYNVLSFGARFWSDENPGNVNSSVKTPGNWNMTWDTRLQPQDDDNHIHRHVPLYIDFEITVAEDDAGNISATGTEYIPSVTLRTGAIGDSVLSVYREWHTNHMPNRYPNP